MYKFRVHGQVYNVPADKVEEFREKFPDAVLETSPYAQQTEQFVVDHKIYNVDATNWDTFYATFGHKVQTLEQYKETQEQIAKHQRKMDRLRGDPFTLSSWQGFYDWWKIDPDETQETNSWSETLFGKNQLTDFFADWTRASGRGWQRGSDIDELGILFKVKNRKLTEAEEKELFEAIKRQGEVGQSDEHMVYMDSRNYTSNGTWNAMDALSGMSPSLMFETFIESTLSMVRGLGEAEGLAWGAAGAGTGAALGAGTAAIAGQLGPQVGLPEELITVPTGAIVGAVTGLFSGVGGALEATGKVGELIREEMHKLGLEFTYENFQKFARENHDLLREIRQKAITKGVTVAAVDTLFGAIVIPGFGVAAGTSTKLAKTLSRPLVRTGIAFGVEGFAGATGEYLSEKFIGEDADPKELMLEAIGGGPVTLVSAAQQFLNPASYTIDGEKVTRGDVWERLSDPNVTDLDVVKSRIVVKNDIILEREVKARENAVAKLAKLPKDTRKLIDNPNFNPDLPESHLNKKQIENPNYNKHLISKEDRELILTLENALEEAENKKAILIDVGGVLTNVQDLKQQVKDIYSKYEGKTTDELRLGDVKMATDIQDVLTERQVEFAKSKQKKAGLVFEAFDFVDQFVSGLKDKIESLGINVEEFLKENKLKSIDEVGSADAVKLPDGTIYINKEQAVQTRTYDSVGSHEILHNIVDGKFNALKTEEKKVLIKDFKKILKSKLDRRTYKKIEKRLKDNYQDLDTNVEWFNVFSDAVANDKTFAERKGLFRSLLKFFNRNVNKHTDYKNLDFGNVDNMYEWIKTYSKDVKAGKERTDVEGLVGITGKEGIVFSRSQAVDAVNKMEQGAKTKAEFRKPEIFNKIYNSIVKEDGAINNYIKTLKLSPEKRQKTIDELSDRLMKYDPAAERKAIDPKTGKVSDKPITVGEFLMANIGYAKLEAAKALAKKSKRTKVETPTDVGATTKEGDVKMQVEDTDVSAQEILDEQDMSIEGIAKREAEEAKAKKKRYSKLRQKLGFEKDKETYNNVLNAAKKSLLLAYRKTQNIKNVKARVDKIVELIKKEYNSLNSPLFKELKNFLGVKEYLTNLRNFGETIIETISTADLVQMERLVPDADKVFVVFEKKLYRKEEVQDAVDKNLLPKDALNDISKRQSVNLYKKVTPTPDQIVGFADQPPINPETGARSGLKGTRKDGFAKRIAEALILDAIMEVRQDVEVQKTLTENLNVEMDVKQLASKIGREVDVKFSKSTAIADINSAIDNGENPNVYLQIRFSKSHRDAYETRLEKNRTDLTKEQRKNAVQSIFDFIDGKNIPNNKKSKYEKMAIHYMANGNLILPEDGYKVIEAERVATIKKIDPLSYKNPNVLLEENVVKKKVKRTNPDNLNTFTNKTEWSDGVVVYDVEDSKNGQLDVRKVVDTHFGKESNPWCLCARGEPGAYIETDEAATRKEAEEIARTHQDLGRTTNIVPYEYKGRTLWEIYVYEMGEKATELDNAFVQWERYNEKGYGFKIAFHNGELVGFRDGNNMQWWDRLDDSHPAPIIRGKKGKDGFKPVSFAYKNKSELKYYEQRIGDKKNGTYTKRNLDGVIVLQETKKNGKLHGERIEVDVENKYSAYYNRKINETYDNGKVINFKEERVYNDYKGDTGVEVIKFGRDEIWINNITKYERTYQVVNNTRENEKTIIEGLIDQKYYEEFQNPDKITDSWVKANLKTLTASSERYYDRQGEKVTVKNERVSIEELAKIRKDFQAGKIKSINLINDFFVSINGVRQDARVGFSKSNVNETKFSLSQLQQDRNTLPAILKKQIEVEKRILTNPTEEDLILLNNLEDLQFAVESGVNYEESFLMFKETLPQDVSSLLVDFKDVNSFENYITNISVPAIRTLGSNAAKTYFKNIFKSLKTDKDKVDLVNKFLKNIGISVRGDVKALEVSFTNQQLLEGPVREIFGDKFVDKHFKTASITEGGKKGKTITYSYDGKKGTFEKVELYADIETIKNSRGKVKVVEKVNEEAVEANEFIDEIINSNLSIPEKLAIIDLLSLNQRGAIRKSYAFGETVTDKVTKPAEDLVLEHEITVKNMTKYLRQRVKGILTQDQLNEIRSQAKVHVWDKSIDVILNAEKTTDGKSLRYEGGRLRYQNPEVKKYLINQFKKGLITNIPIELNQASNLDNLVRFSRSTKNPTKGISILDFDDTLATTKSLVRFTRPDGTEGTLTPEQYASTYQDLLGLDYKFDFSEFTKVIDGKPAPLLNKAKKLAGKFGTDNMFILTARPAESAVAIQKFLKENGLNIPIKNITGLGNSTSEAKVSWVLEKATEGYNDFYFADDAIQNVKAVKNMLSQIDVKSKVQQAKVNFSNSMDKDFNSILEEISGIDAKKRFSDVKAKRRGKGKGRFRFFIPPSHEDFIGLLYNFMGRGRRGDQHRNFFEKALIRPLNRAFRELNGAKQAIANDYRTLLKKFPKVKKKLGKKILDGDFTHEDAIRVYLWDKFWLNIPGMSKTDQRNLSEFVKSDPELQSFADNLGRISQAKMGYVQPSDNWDIGGIKWDLVDATGRIGRAKFFEEFVENVNIIFSKENLNKIEAVYGKNFREALEDILYRIENGTNRPTGLNRQVNRWLDWINGSVGATMFFNARSAVLQQLSFVNFMNFADNNIFKAAARFADQKQFWKDFVTIFNSDYLKQRRAGAGFDLSANEIAREVSNAKDPVSTAIRYILNKGFLPTQMGDSFAIALGGASFLRNRINTYLKQGLSKKEAEVKAFLDFQRIAEATQQSARPDMISQQQASPLGRLILAFQNVTSQYARIVKKSAIDLIKRRISPGYTSQKQSDMANISRIIYYGAIQSMIFYALQSAVFAMMFDDDEEFFEDKKDRVINGTIDSLLRGTGVGGTVVSTLKNYIWKTVENEQSDSYFKSPAWIELLQISPPIQIKIRKIRNAERNLEWDGDVMREMELFDIDNPIWESVTSWTEAFTNIPTDRLRRKIQNLRAASDSENAYWQRIALVLGWNKWDLGIEDVEVEEVKEKLKEEKKIEKKKKDDIKREEKKKETEEENKTREDENKKKSKKDGICAAISRSGNRCKKKVESGSVYCTIHTKVEQTDKKVRCKKIKSDGKRCKMQTNAKSGLCYYHD